MIFALATKDLSPPELVFLRPDNAQYCTGRGEFQQNELVLAYNARPDCFGRFAWGERAVFFRDDSSHLFSPNFINFLLIKWKKRRALSP